jgi:hypothetical protein
MDHVGSPPAAAQLGQRHEAAGELEPGGRLRDANAGEAHTERPEPLLAPDFGPNGHPERRIDTPGQNGDVREPRDRARLLSADTA